MKPENMIGKLVKIKDTNEYWRGFWGFVRAWDGEHFHVSGGSITEDQFPIFSRYELTIPRDLTPFIQMGVKLDNRGRERK